MIEYFKSLSFQTLTEKVKNNIPILIDTVTDSEIATIITFIEKCCKKNILIISTDRKKDLLYKNLSYFLDNLLEFPAWGTLPTDEIKPSSDIVGARFEVLNTLINDENNQVLITTLHSLLQKTVSYEKATSLYFTLKLGDLYEFDFLMQKFTDLGYQRVALVTDKAQFAIRGGIIDIFPANAENPFRIEFFSDKVESIRIFDLATQKSFEKKDCINIFTADELKLIQNDQNLKSILSYFSKDYIVIFDDIFQIEDTLFNLNIKPSKYFLSFDELLEIISNQEKIYFSEKNIKTLSEIKTHERITYFQNIEFESFGKKLKTDLWMHPFISLESFLDVEKIDNILDFLPHLIEKQLKIIFLVSQESEKIHISELLEEKNISFSENIIFVSGFLDSGYIISDIRLCIIPYNEITHRKVIRRQKFREAYHAPYAEYHQLEIGDLVVHQHSGIGKYIGREKLSNHLGIDTEFFIIEYAQNSRLYVPISQAHLISRYIGATEELPTLSELGSNKWQKTKLLAQKQIIGYASDLLHMQAQRETHGGFEYPLDSEETKLFELDFPYIETHDQINAIKNIKDDMTSLKAMDRLICGDVGYGKTEVAMRAAFKAVYDGRKQVAVLVPTTVLAMQHFDTFKERMASFPINIDIVSRFKTTKQNRQVLESVKQGNVDILIGTHRILSQDVDFKDLGLIIIDEEQRFGVRAKEHLKKLKHGVDCLTISATPIPRTLYMSLIKVKDMSVINTPPQDRLPIKTIIVESEDDIIKNAILREKARQGQVFFIHNRVESIYKRAEHIQNLTPHVIISIVHGQMPTDEVDSIFHKFKQGDIDILFSTTIVENGIDVPNANTIIIDRADAFGLADLYQLRGRVGRWNRAAYAYFLTPKRRQISEISQKRLNVLLEAPGYGEGIKIAMRDLEIRGAGDILGVKQSGQIANIGFHLYCRLLKKAILSLKDKKEASFIDTKLEFAYAASLPENYINEPNLRMEVYYRLGDASTFEQVDQIKGELIDRFGPLPTEVIELLALTKIRVYANQNSFISLKFGNITLICERLYKNKKIQKTLILPKKTDSEIFKDRVITLLQENFDL